MEPISRRQALLLGGLGAAATVIGGAGLLWGFTSLSGLAEGDALAAPAELHSSGGRLEVDLVADQGPVRIGGRTARTLRYNGTLPGPTLRLRAGDQLTVSLHNRLDEATNLHVHGLHVSPQGNGDNPFVRIAPGATHNYAYQLAEDHPPGVYWYHPHHHGTVADQVFGGLYGALIVEDPEPVAASRERVLVISDISLDASGGVRQASFMDRAMGRQGQLLLVNGQVRPRMEARPGERERWRLVNACVSRYLLLRLDGQQLQLLGLDSDRTRSPETTDEVLLAPGNRADLLVTASAGTSRLRAVPYDRGSMGGMMGLPEPGPDAAGGEQTLASLAVAGTAALPPARVTFQGTSRDLRTLPVAASRELVFSVDMGAMMGAGPEHRGFTINGREFDPDRTDVTVQAGSIEEWTLTNTSPMDHPVHLHVWPMQLVEDAGQIPEGVLWRDVVNVPARGQVRVRIAFGDYTGRSVFHCHILDHEDNGMMGVVEVV